MSQLSSTISRIDSKYSSPPSSATDSYFNFVLKTFTCGVCGELLSDPVTLPCGNCVCCPCFRPSIPQIPPELNCPLGFSFQQLQLQSQAEVYGISYKCPVKGCTKHHGYRYETTSVMVADLMDKCLPSVRKAYALIKEGYLSLRAFDVKLWSDYEKPNWSNCCSRLEGIQNIIDTYLTPAIHFAPILQHAFLTRARAYLELGLISQALSDVTTAIHLNPKNTRGQTARAHILEAVGYSIDVNHISLDPRLFSAISLFNKKNENLCQLILPTELECSLCYNIMYEPITCPCGHTWCRSCIVHLSQINSSEFVSCSQKPLCPLCRATLPCFRFLIYRPSTKVIMAFIKRFYESLYKQRCSTLVKSPLQFNMKIPIVVCNLVFPEIPAFLQFTRPRTRLLFKNCMKQNIPFGVCLAESVLKEQENEEETDPEQSSQSLIYPHCMPPTPAYSPPKPFVDFGTTVNVLSYETLFDDEEEEPFPQLFVGEKLPKYLIHSKGGYRFRVLQREQDDIGNQYAYVERVEDQLSEDEDESDDEEEEDEAEEIDEDEEIYSESCYDEDYHSEWDQTSSSVDYTQSISSDMDMMDISGNGHGTAPTTPAGLKQKEKRTSVYSEWSCNEYECASTKSEPESIFMCPAQAFFAFHAKLNHCVTEAKSRFLKSCPNAPVKKWWAFCESEKAKCRKSSDVNMKLGSTSTAVGGSASCSSKKDCSASRSERMRKARMFVEGFVKTLPCEEQQRFERLHGECPDPAVFAFWLAHMLPHVSEAEKYSLLCMTSGRKRLKVVLEWVSKAANGSMMS